MKNIVMSFLVLFNISAYSAVTDEQLGKLLLEEKYSEVNQRYLDYYGEGPTSDKTFGGYHPGIDFQARIPLAVYSPVSGVVGSIDKKNLGRVSILIDGTTNYFIFLHLSQIDVSEGKRVNVGDTIGYTGAVGTPAPHLHVEVRNGRQTAAYYFQKDTSGAINSGVNINPIDSVSLDDQSMMTYVFNMVEKNYTADFPAGRRKKNTTIFQDGGYREYETLFSWWYGSNYLYLWDGTGTVWYRIYGNWYDSHTSIKDWYYGWGGF